MSTSREPTEEHRLPPYLPSTRPSRGSSRPPISSATSSTQYVSISTPRTGKKKTKPKTAAAGGEPNGDPACFPQNPEEIVFVPMVFGSDRNHHDTDPEVADYMDTVLGYNEPDKKNDISPVEAALQWSNLTQIYSDKVRKQEGTRRKCRIIR